MSRTEASISSTAESRLTLAELVDLELALQQDRTTPIEDLDARDGPLALHLAGALTTRGNRGLSTPVALSRAALRTWLHSVQPLGAPSAGTRFAELRELAGTCLFLLGGTSGALTIGTWLLQGTGTPVNIAVFWPAVIGLQLGLLIGFGLLAATLPFAGRIPGLRGLARILMSVSTALPWLTLRLLARFSGRPRDEWNRLLGELRALDWLYRPLRLWLMTSLTQGFAIGFNLGAIVAFLAIPTLDDPAFGWRSRLLDSSEIHSTARAIALPWRSWLPDALPSRADVEATRYSSIAARYGSSVSPEPPQERPDSRAPTPEQAPSGAHSRAAAARWETWWPFLFASLVTYGLAPRLLLWAAAQLAVHRQLARAPRPHSELERLTERLARLAVDTRARTPELRADEPTSSELRTDALRPDSPLHLLCWAGVPESDATVRARFEARGLHIDQFTRVGGVECRDDERALRGLSREKTDPSQVCLIVEAWEPPVGDYLDFVRALRRARGDEEVLWVLLFRDPRDADSDRDRDRESRKQWELALRGIGDPWLRLGDVPEVSP